jgi:hypothetical protein
MTFEVFVGYAIIADVLQSSFVGAIITPNAQSEGV